VAHSLLLAVNLYTDQYLYVHWSLDWLKWDKREVLDRIEIYGLVRRGIRCNDVK
jgi:hypothetical protein